MNSFEEFDNKEEVKKETKGEQLLKRLNEIDINRLTPIEALNFLYELKDLE